MNNLNNYTIYAIPHYHFDVEWWQIDTYHAEDAIIIISKAIELLEKYPEFTYVLDQVLSVRPFYERCKDKQDILKRLIREKRIEVVGQTFAAPDENIPYGESLIRQFLYAKKFFQDVLEADVKVGWLIDEFGHIAQLPQILKKAGLSYFVFSRGIIPYDKDMPLDFYWVAPDGSKILTHWFKGHYGGYMSLYKSKSKNIKRFYKETIARIEYESKYNKTLLFPFGTDFTLPTSHWIEFVNKWNKEKEPQIIFSTPTKYFEKIEKEQKEFNIIEGEFNPVFTGCYESREKVKKLCRLTQNKVLAAEKLNTIAYLLNEKFSYPEKDFEYIWERILENDFHDILCGTGTDKVYLNTIRRYNEALNIINKNIDNATNAIIKEIDTENSAKDIPYEPLVVFNTLNWPVEDVVVTKIKNKEAKNKNIKVVNETGNEVVSQVFNGEVYFLGNVPSLGYRVYFVTNTPQQSVITNPSPLTTNLENQFYKIQIDEDTGGITSIYDKELDKELLDTKKYQGAQIIQEEDAGNLWTIMKTGKKFMKNKILDIKIETQGAVFSQLLIREKHSKMNVMKRIRIYNRLKRIDFEIEIDFFGKDRRVKVLFPLNINDKTIYYETPFYLQERPEGHYPGQNFVEIAAKTNDYGIALINSGNPSYEVYDNIIALGLFRSVSLYSWVYTKYLFKNLTKIIKASIHSAKLFNKGLNIVEFPLYPYHGIGLREWSTEGGPRCFGTMSFKSHIVPYLKFWKKALCWEHGKHNFKFALYPHKESIKNSDVERVACQFNNPLICVKTSSHKGNLPKVKSFIEIDKDNIILTTLKKKENADDIILRFYETKGKGDRFEVTFFKEIKSATKVNLTEDKKYKELKIENNNRISDTIGKYEIYTLTIP